jgi:hypothetical protein
MRDAGESDLYTGIGHGRTVALIPSGDEQLNQRVREFLTAVGVIYDGPQNALPPAAVPIEVVDVADDHQAVLDMLASHGLLPRIAEEATFRVAAARHLGRAVTHQRSEGVAHQNLSNLVPPSPCDAVASVVITCREDGELLLDALASVRLCASEGLEVVVVDDGSTSSATVRILGELEQLGTKVAYQEHSGVVRARNLGVSLTTAPYIVHLDADTLLRPGFVPTAAVILSDEADVGTVWASTSKTGAAPMRTSLPPFDLARLLRGNYLDSFAVVRRRALDEVGGWDEHLEVGEDWDLWLSLADAGWRTAMVDLIGGDRLISSPLEDPEVRIATAVAMAEKHHSLYHRNIGEVIRTYMTVPLDQQSARSAPVTAEPGRSEEARRIRELGDELAASRAEADLLARAARAAREAVADAEMRATAAESEAADRALAESRAEVAESRAAHAEAERVSLLATRTFRWTAGLRRVYGRCRSAVRRTEPR